MIESDWNVSTLIWLGQQREHRWWHVAYVMPTRDGRWWNGFVRVSMN